MDNAKKVLWVGGERNTHGTRIARRIECGRCGREDHISSRLKAGQAMLCRECARTQIGAVDIGKHIPVSTEAVRCTQCKNPFLAISRVAQREDPLCPDCYRGFAVWRGSVECEPGEREAFVTQKQRSGTLLRRRVSGLS